MKAGDLRQFIDLLCPATGTNEKGLRIDAWKTAESCVPAQKQDVSGREFYKALAYHAEDTVTFTIRWRDDIQTTWRVLYEGTAYNILEINGLGEMRDYIRLKCRAVTGGG